MTRLHVCGYKPLLGTFIQFVRDMTRLHVCGYITFTRDFIQFVRDMTRIYVCGYITFTRNIYSVCERYDPFTRMWLYNLY